MFGGVFKFIFAIVVFIVIGIIANPVLAALGTNIVLPNWGVFLCSLCAAGGVVGS